MPSSTMLSVRVHLKQISHSKILMGTRIPISNNHQHIHWCYQGKKKRGWGGFFTSISIHFQTEQSLTDFSQNQGKRKQEKGKKEKIKKKATCSNLRKLVSEYVSVTEVPFNLKYSATFRENPLLF